MKIIKNIILKFFSPQMIPVTMWTERHRASAERMARELDNICIDEKTDAQEDLQERLSDMLEDYKDIHG